MIKANTFMAAIMVVEYLLLWQLLSRSRWMRGFSLCEGIVGAFVVWSATLCVTTEVLSLATLLSPKVLLIIHGAAFVALVSTRLYNLCKPAICSSLDDQSNKAYPVLNNSQRINHWCIVLAGLLSIAPVISAVSAPPSNWDSMTYHLPRVMRWLIQGSLEHYPTYISRQLYLNPGHEMILAHGIGLGGSDRYAGLLNSAAFFVAMLAGAAVARRIGGGIYAELVAVIFIATIPMGILQASTTQTDLLHGTFTLSALLGMLMVRHGVGGVAEVLLWGGAGLAVLTKGLSLFWIPATALIAFPYRRYFTRRGVTVLACGMLFAFLLNVGHWSRNFISFGHPLGPTQGPVQLSHYSVSEISIKTVLSNFIRTAALHSNLPFFDTVGWSLQQTVNLHKAIGIDVNDPRATWLGTLFQMSEPSRIHEDLAGNGGPLVIMFISTIFLTISLTRRERGALLKGSPLIAALVGFVLIFVFVSWQPWASRLQLPLFMVAAPGCAAILCSRYRSVGGLVLALLAIASAVPYWIHNELRPLVGSASILSGDDEAQRYNAKPFLYPEFIRVSQQLRASGCNEIGLVNSEDEWEHGVFASLGGNISVRSCRVSQKYGRYLWLAHKRVKQPPPCALLWFGADAPGKVKGCGSGYKRLEVSQSSQLGLFRLE